MKKTRKKIPTPVSSDDDEANLAVPIESDTDSAAETDEELDDVVPDVVEVGKFVLVKYAAKKKTVAYVDMVVEKSEQEWRIDFYKRNHQGNYIKPENDDISLVSPDQIVKVLGAPISSGTTARTLGSLSFRNKIPNNGYDLC